MRPLIVVSLLSLLLSACGQTGPLYLPKDEPAKLPASTTTDQPVTEEPMPEQHTPEQHTPEQHTPEKQEGL